MSQTRSTSAPLPHSVASALSRLDRRIRGAAAVRGLGQILVGATMLAVVAMTVDAWRDLASSVRWATWVAGVAVVAVGAVGLVLRPLARRASRLDLARRIEEADPSWDGRLAAAVDLLEPHPGQAPHGSPGLIAALADQVTRRVDGLSPNLALPRTGRAVPWLLAGVGASGLVAMACGLRPDPVAALAVRTLAPWRGVDRVVIRVEPGDAVVARGTGPTITAIASARFGPAVDPSSSRVEWTDAQGQTQSLAMGAETGGNRFRATLPGLAGSATYRICVGRTESRTYRLDVAEPARVVALEAQVEPPAYTRQPAGPAPDPRRLAVRAGGTVAFRVVADRPVDEIIVFWPPVGQGPPRVERVAQSSPLREAQFRLPVAASGRFDLRLGRDDRGLAGTADGGQIQVLPDLAPTLRVSGPPPAAETGPNDVLRVGIEARDDLGVARAELHHEVRRAGTASATGATPITLTGSGSPQTRGAGAMALGSLGLRPGDQVAWRVRVLDNRPEFLGGPNETWSPWSSIAVVGQAEPMEARSNRLRRDAIVARLEKIREATSANRRDLEASRKAADAARNDRAAWTERSTAELATRESAAAQVVDQLRELAGELAADPDFAPLAPAVDQVAAVEAESARAGLAGGRKATDPAARVAEIRKAMTRLDATRDKVDGLRQRLDTLTRLADDRRKLGDLAAREEALAGRAESGTTPNQLSDDQEQIRRELENLLTQAPVLRASVLKAQADEAAKLADQARALAERQRAEARRDALRTAGDDPIGALAEAQRQIENDTRQLALDVDEPLAVNGRARIDIEGVRRVIEPLTQGQTDRVRQTSEEAESMLRRVARDLAEVPTDHRALARRLATRQEALANEVAAATAEARQQPGNLPDDAQNKLRDRLAPLADRQAAVADLLGSIPAEGPIADAVREARKAVDRARDNLRDPRPRESESIQNAARQAVRRVADQAEDPNRRRDETRRLVEDARRRQEEIAREVDRKIEETALRPDRPADRAARDLADRIEPLVRRQEEAVAQLAKLADRSLDPARREHVVTQANALRDAMAQAREAAPRQVADPKPRPPGSWSVVGPFPTMTAAPPFPVGGPNAPPIDLSRPVPSTEGPQLNWRAAPTQGDEGRVDLGALLGPLSDRCAFGVTTITSPAPARTTLLIGSDDSLTVWLNGVRVYDQTGARSYSANQDRVDVELPQGISLLLVRCGNVNGEWRFSVNTPPPPPEGFDPARAQEVRETLAQAGVAAQAAVERLAQEVQGKQPADNLARELARELEAALARPGVESADDLRRIRTALANLPAPDATTEKAEAVRRAEALTQTPTPTAEAARQAIDGTLALARKLGGPDAPPAPAKPAVAEPELGIDAGHVARAEDLAKRQRHVREAMQAVLAGRSEPQVAIRRDTEKLGQSLQDLRARVHEARAQSEWQVGSAADLASNQAPEAMKQAIEQTAQGRVENARESGRRASDLVERVARHADDLVAGLRAEANQIANTPQAGGSPPAPDGLADAMSAIREASRQAGTPPGQGQNQGQGQAQPGASGERGNPAPAMRRAAESLRAAAQTPGQGPGMGSDAMAGTGEPGSPGMPGGDAANPQSAPAGTAAADLSTLPELVRRRSGRAWGDLPPHLRAEIIQQAQGRPRAEYARLIELYFREIADQSATNPPATPR